MVDVDWALLGMALRARPDTVTALAALAERSHDDIDAALAALEQDGLIHRDGDRIRYRSPDHAVADRVIELIAQQERKAIDGYARIRDIVRELPGLGDDWSVGAHTDAPALRIEILHGPDAGTELWRRQIVEGVPFSAAAVLPDLHRFHYPDIAEQQHFLERTSARGGEVRAIVAATEAEHPSIRSQLDRFAEAGIEIRMHAHLPSWFWIHDDHTIAMPLTWGEAWPTSVMAVHSEPIAAMTRTMFETLWGEAVPTVGATREADPLLRLMKNGATLDAASRWLGITPRTGRRRIAAAMDHYGAQTLFGLGVAWAEAGDSGQSRTSA